MTTKEEAREAEAWASKAVVELVEAFRVGEEYHQMVLDLKFCQSFELCKKWVIE